jgi:protein-L-isoaspartate(D-aspartate) O-methyltransferase
MSSRPARQFSPFELQRQQLVSVLASRGIADARVLQAIGSIPREEFIPPALYTRAYEDSALPIDNRQLLGVRPGVKILEIGTGSGYQAAVLAVLGAHVVSIERHALLSQKARTVLQRLGFHVTCRIGDGTIGYREGGPYDGIIITAGAPDVPEPLARQLAIGGKMIVPIGSLEEQRLYTVVRTGDEAWKAEDVGPAKFVPLIGRSGWDE